MTNIGAKLQKYFRHFKARLFIRSPGRYAVINGPMPTIAGKGCMALKVSFSVFNDEFAWIQRVTVDQHLLEAEVLHFGVTGAYQRLGIGAAMLSWFLNYLNENLSIGEVTFRVKPDTDRHRLLTKFSAEQVGRVNSAGYAPFRVTTNPGKTTLPALSISHIEGR